MKDKLAKLLAMAKKQMAVLICTAIVIVSVVLAYWPTTGWYVALAANVQKSIADAQSMDKLLKLDRHLPNISGDANAPAQSLPLYPTQAVVAQGKAAVQSFNDASSGQLTLAVQLNEHFPLTPDALPNGNNVDRDKFARDFKDAVGNDAYIRKWPPVEIKEHFKNLFEIPDLAAGQAPSADEIQAKLAQVKKDVGDLFGANAQANPDVTRQINERSTEALMQMYQERANACKVYLQPGAIKPPLVLSNFNNAVAALPPADLWSAQLWLWVVEDAATAVARANADAKSVIDAPVKQILDLTVKEPPYLVSGDPTAGTDISVLPPALDVTPTGRVSNGMYDVLQFSMSLDVDADRVPEILDLLERGQFITVLSVQYTALDSSEKAVKGFVYGKARIVKLDLVCEDLYLKAWDSKYCPPNAGPSAGQAAGPGGGGPGQASTGNMLPVSTHQQ